MTLTYDDDNCPLSLDKTALQKFWKRFRKLVDVPIRYFACGEYGSLNWRPHYHALVLDLISKISSYSKVLAFLLSILLIAWLSFGSLETVPWARSVLEVLLTSLGIR